MPNSVGVLLIATVQQATLAGVVRDSVDLEPVAFARVTVAALGGGAALKSGVSDRFGAFVVPGVPVAGSVRVDVNAFGYATWTRTYEGLPSDPVRVLLSPAPIGLEELDVAAGGRSGDPLSLSRGVFVVDSALIRSLPTILETDVLRAIAASPSASGASDYASVPFIRGGTSGGTPVLLDGVRLFNAFHLGGFVSAINAEVVERATLLPGSGGDGFAVGSLSGAIDIATRDGSRSRRRMAGSVGLASSRFSVEGPAGETVSYLLDGRRTYVDGLTMALKKLGVIDGHAPYFFQDVHAKVTADLGEIRRLSVSGYANSESAKRFDEAGTPDVEMTWGNSAFSVHYRDRLGSGAIIDASLGHSRFTSDVMALGGGGGRKEGDSIVDYAPPTVSEAPVPRNTEISVGWQGLRGGLRVRLEAYARRLDHLRLLDPALEGNPLTGRVLGDPSKWEVSGGAARGIEASWSWMDDVGISVLGSYRWARVSRTVASRTYTPRFHRDHEFEVGSTYGHGASSWSARVSLRSGQPVTHVFAIVPVTKPWPDPGIIDEFPSESVTLGGD